MNAVSDTAGIKRISHASHGPREGRLLALFKGRADAASSVGSALRRQGASAICIEGESVDGMQAIRATWPIDDPDLMDAVWLHRVVQRIAPADTDRVRANLGSVRRLGIFVSKTSHCLADLLQRNFSGTLHCEIAFIVSNHEDCRPLADLYGVPFYYFDMSRRSKESVEADQLGLLASHDVHLVVLARYMRILSPAFVDRYPGRIINIHHSLLPAFIGADPYQRAIDRGVKVIGATAHYVTAELDAGPIIEQETARVTHRDDAASLRAKGAELERLALVRAVRLHVEDRVLPVNDRVVVFEGHAARHDALLEGLLSDPTPERAATEEAHQWFTTDFVSTESPLLDLQGALPRRFEVAERSVALSAGTGLA